MNVVFDHIKQMRYLLSQIFESGFVSGRNTPAIDEGKKIAAELGMQGGAELLEKLSKSFTALAAGQTEISKVVVAYCNIVSYYNLTEEILAIKTILKKEK
jgi:hypothetical protein